MHIRTELSHSTSQEILAWISLGARRVLFLSVPPLLLPLLLGRERTAPMHLSLFSALHASSGICILHAVYVYGATRDAECENSVDRRSPASLSLLDVCVLLCSRLYIHFFFEFTAVHT